MSEEKESLCKSCENEISCIKKNDKVFTCTDYKEEIIPFCVKLPKSYINLLEKEAKLNYMTKSATARKVIRIFLIGE